MNEEKGKNSNKRNAIIIIIILAIVTIPVILFTINQDQTSLMVQTESIMDGIPNHCYVSSPDLKNPNPDSAGAIYYPEMIKEIYKKQIKYPFPFLRSASFQIYLFLNCPYLDSSKYKIPEKFNQSIASENLLIKPSKYLNDLESKEQKMHEYDFKTNPQKYSRIEDVSSAFGLTLPQVIDRLFWENATNIDSCINPSWRTNSTIRQCQYENSHFIVDLQEQLMGILDTPPANMTGKEHV